MSYSSLNRANFSSTAVLLWGAAAATTATAVARKMAALVVTGIAVLGMHN